MSAQTTAAGPSLESPSSASKRVEHPTESERAARGKAARAEVPRSAHAAWEPQPQRPSPVRPARGAGADAGAGARADPLRADARLAVHLLPRRRLPDGVGPGRHAANEPARAALRRRASVELRRLRGARPAAGLQHQRLRRDATRGRSSGTSSGWPRASPSRAATAASTTSSERRSTSPSGARYREAMHEYAGMRNLDLWYTRVDVERCSPSFDRSATAKQRKRADKNLAKARDEGQPEGVCEADRDRRRRAAHHQRPARRLRRSRTSSAERRGSSSKRSCTASCAPTGERCRATAVGCSSATATSTSPAKWWASAASARGLHHAAARPRRQRPAVPSVQGGRGLGARAVPRQERVRKPRPAGRRGPAAHPGGQRHHARLDQRRGRRRRHSATSTSASSGTAKGSALVEVMDPQRMRRLRRASAAGARPRARPLRRRDRDRELPRRQRHLRPRASRSSPRPTQTRTNATIKRSRKQSSTGRSKSRQGCQRRKISVDPDGVQRRH